MLGPPAFQVAPVCVGGGRRWAGSGIFCRRGALARAIAAPAIPVLSPFASDSVSIMVDS